MGCWLNFRGSLTIKQLEEELPPECTVLDTKSSYGIMQL